jgi:hypothetical protein
MQPLQNKDKENKETSSTSSKESSGSPKTGFLSKFRKEGSRAFSSKGSLPLYFPPVKLISFCISCRSVGHSGHHSTKQFIHRAPHYGTQKAQFSP